MNRGDALVAEASHRSGSRQANIPEEQDDRGKEPKPDLPANPRPLSHAQHAVHGALEPGTGIFEGVVHLFRQGSRVSDLVSDRGSELRLTLAVACWKRPHGLSYLFQHLHLGRHALDLLIILALQLVQKSIAVLALGIGRR